MEDIDIVQHIHLCCSWYSTHMNDIFLLNMHFLLFFFYGSLLIFTHLQSIACIGSKDFLVC